MYGIYDIDIDFVIKVNVPDVDIDQGQNICCWHWPTQLLSPMYLMSTLIVSTTDSNVPDADIDQLAYCISIGLRCIWI